MDRKLNHEVAKESEPKGLQKRQSNDAAVSLGKVLNRTLQKSMKTAAASEFRLTRQVSDRTGDVLTTPPYNAS